MVELSAMDTGESPAEVEAKIERMFKGQPKVRLRLTCIDFWHCAPTHSMTYMRVLLPVSRPGAAVYLRAHLVTCGHVVQGFPFDDFDLHDVMLPEDEGDFGYPSDDDEIDEEEVVTETGFGSVIGERAYLHPADERLRSVRAALTQSTATRYRGTCSPVINAFTITCFLTVCSCGQPAKGCA